MAQSPSPTAIPVPTPIPAAQIVAAAEADLAATLPDSDSTARISKVAETLDRLTSEIRSRSAASQLAPLPTSDLALQSEAAAWGSFKTDLGSLKTSLKAEAGRLDLAKQKLADAKARWTATQGGTKDLPPEIAGRVKEVLKRLQEEGRQIRTEESALLGIQNAVAGQEAIVEKSITAIDQARKAVLGRLMIQDSRPLWDLGEKSSAPESSDQDRVTFRAQLAALGTYLAGERGGLLLHLVLWSLLLVCFQWARRRTQAWVEAEPQLQRSTRVFEVPFAAASLAALSVFPVFYPDAPRLLATVFGAVLLVPLVIVVRRLVEPSLMPLTWALAVFYFTGQVREAVTGVPGLPRFILFAETVIAAGFALWLVRISRQRLVSGKSPLWRIIRFGAGLAVAAFLLASVANLLGYTHLAAFSAHVMISSAFVAVLLYTARRIANGLVTFALWVPPLALFSAVRRHRLLLERRCSMVFRVLAVAAWAWFTLEQLTLRKPLFAKAAWLFNEQLRFGPITAADLLAFIVTIWAAFLLSRFVRFLLDEEVYRRLRLAPGMPFAISTLLHYAILFAGFYLAAAILIGDMTKFTILAGAFSVGIGFGLQNIVNNFVSGIIVLFERPVKLGDVIQIGPDVGTVRQIGIRATVIRTPGGSEIIVPNGKLISDPVTNWTLSDRERMVEISIATPLGANPNRVMHILREVAMAHPKVSETPFPRVELTKVAGGALSFDLRAATRETEDWSEVRSELTLAIHERLQAEGIAIA